MGWRLHGCYIFTRTLSFTAAHLAWIFAVLSGCRYFQLWKSYDIFWLWVYIIVSCIVPRLRYDNLILQCSFLWRKTCSEGQLWRYALKDQDRRIDEEENKLADALDLGVTLLRFRVSGALVLGNIHVCWVVPRLDNIGDWSAQNDIIDWPILQYTVWVDLCLLWFMLLMIWFRQCWLCCRLGCWRFYLWSILVVVVGALLMEIPMYFAFQRLDRTWCRFNATSRHAERDEFSASTVRSSPMSGLVSTSE